MTTDSISPAVKAPALADDTGTLALDDSKQIVKSVTAVKAEFLEDCVRLDLGKGYQKLIEYSDFDAEWTKFMGKKEVETKEVGLMLPSGVVWMSHSATKLKIMCYYPEGVKNINYRGNSVPRVAPNVIISHTLDSTKTGWKVTGSWYLATDLPLSQMSREFYTKSNHAKNIFILPFSNMYDNGTMCTGANQLPKSFDKGDIRGLHHYHEMVFNSPFNNDLGVKAVGTGSRYCNAEDWFALLREIALKPNPKFPYEHLMGYKKPVVAQAPSVAPVADVAQALAADDGTVLTQRNHLIEGLLATGTATIQGGAPFLAGTVATNNLNNAFLADGVVTMPAGLPGTEIRFADNHQ